MTQDGPRVCVIGAGLSGLTSGKALRERGVPYTYFEASDDIGGNWYFRNPNGRSSAYGSLHIDTTKRALGFSDFSMDARYPDFPHHTEIHRYLSEYAEHFGLREQIRFRTPVEQAQRRPGGGWRIGTGDDETHEFDALLVCNGHHWDPSFPMFAGNFDGPVLHSHHYIDPTDPLDLRGKRVVVVGIGNSGVDIVSELSRKGGGRARLDLHPQRRLDPAQVRVRTARGPGLPDDPVAVAAAPALSRGSAGPSPVRADGGLRAAHSQPPLSRGAPDGLKRARWRPRSGATSAGGRASSARVSATPWRSTTTSTSTTCASACSPAGQARARAGAGAGAGAPIH